MGFPVGSRHSLRPGWREGPESDRMDDRYEANKLKTRRWLKGRE